MQQITTTERRETISYTKAKKLSQEKKVNGIIVPNQNISFDIANKHRNNGEEIEYFKVGENELVGYRRKGLTDKIIENWNLDMDQIWAIEQYEKDYTLSHLTNHARSNFNASHSNNSGSPSMGIADVKIMALKRLKIAREKFKGNLIRLALMDALVLDGFSLRALEKKFKRNRAIIKKLIIEAFEILVVGYKKIFINKFGG